MTKRIYKTTEGIKRYSTSIYIDGKEQIVEFEGGSSIGDQPGKLVVTDPKVAEALEKKNGFGIDYVLLADFSEEDKESIPEVNPNLIKAEGITTVSGAKEFLLNKYSDLTQAEIANKKLVLEVASIKGIEFPDLA